MTTTALDGNQPTNGAAGLGALGEGIAYESPPADRDEGRRSRLTLITSAEFAGLDLKHEWLIEKVLVKGQPCILGGPRKALKTGILVDMAVTLAAPQPAEPAAEDGHDDEADDAGPGRPAGRPVARSPRFLGHFEVPRPARVGLFSGESGAATLRETAHRICAARGTTLARSGICWGFDLPRLADPRDVDHLARLIDDHGLEVVLLDPLYLMLAGGAAPIDAGNLFQVGPLLAEVTRACLEAGATLVLAHHARKNRPADERYEPLELEDLAYAGIQEFARQWLLVSRRERYDASGTHRLWLGAGGSAGFGGIYALDVVEGVVDGQFGGRTWQTRVQPAAAARHEEAREARRKGDQQEAAKLDKHREAIRDYLREHPQGDTRSAICAGVGLNAQKGGPIVEAMVKAGELAPCKVTKARVEHDGYKLAESVDDGE